MNFVAFPSIEGFHHIVKYAAAYPEAITGPVQYRGKMKLHGTNAGIRVLNGEVCAQSRTQLITPLADNAGFARWVESCKDFWRGVGTDCVVFGEWCGPGIMKGTAINQIPKKIFAVFAIFVGEDMISDPEKIEEVLANRPDDVHILPWEGEAFTIDYCSQASMRATAPSLNAVVETVEKCDPWVKKVFGVEGIGEGVVYYPITDKVKVFSDFAFKAKGEEHRVVKAKEAVQVAPEVAKGINDFVSMFVTEPRMEQGLAAIGGHPLMPKVGEFLKWEMADIAKESVVELEAAGLTWDKVQKAVLAACREWYIKRSRAV